ncbi:YigZ family protein [Microbacterium sp. H1-D42]|uniref:IMPACT family protein n=1 Tax=Microbacterium sp. H1-D42 TaxID=2925844 RepID=UPI001F52C780|nr:YigZ family protein [Microbacterium sp. H1-D42]UNK71756.1 YigZ family protein [Microbacterium sp. H1-D42]
MSEASHPFPATIAAPVDHELVIKKSRFLTRVVPVTAPEHADEVIAEVKKRYWDARHNCSAQVTGLRGDRARSSDDGEPSGTAGMPMLEVLRRRELTDVVAVVTRYFGGIKLGAGGLVRAYSTAVSEALDTASLVDRMLLSQATLAVSHADAGRFENLLRMWTAEHGAVLEDTVYSAEATFEVWAPGEALPALAADVAAASGGSVAALATGAERVIDVPR